MSRGAKRLLLALGGPPLLLSLLFVTAEALLALGPDRRPCFLKRGGAIDGERFAISGRAPTPSSKLRTPDFSARPPADTIRVLTLGDSTMHGVPFDPPLPFADWLALRLPRLHPGRVFEVVNLGASGMCSEDVLDLLRESGGAGASLVIVYVGHNEFLDLNLPRVLDPAGHALRRALLRTRVGTALLDASKQPPRGLAADVVNRRAFVHDSPMIAADARARGIENYRRNLGAIVDLAKGWGIRVALFRPVSDAWDTEPYLSCFGESTSRADRDRFVAEAGGVRAARLGLEAAAERGEAIEPSVVSSLLQRLDALDRIDGSVALSAWERGRLLFLRGERDPARAALQAALDRDGYPTRLPPACGDVVADVASRMGAILVDAAPLFDAEAAPGLPDQRGLFVDDVHPGRRGHELLAEALVHALAREGWLAPTSEWRFDKEPSIEEYRALSGFRPEAQATALAREAFIKIGASQFDRRALAALRAAEHDLDLAVAIDAGCAEARLGRAMLAAIRGDGEAALSEMALARARSATIDALLVEPWETVPDMRRMLEAAGLSVVDGRLVRRP